MIRIPNYRQVFFKFFISFKKVKNRIHSQLNEMKLIYKSNLTLVLFCESAYNSYAFYVYISKTEAGTAGLRYSQGYS